MHCLYTQDALRGPSDCAHNFGDIFRLSDGTELMDDSLTNDECDLICSTYNVYTGVQLYASIV
jgi:hypothetical protein